MTDKIKLCSEALVLIGAGPISSLEGPDARQIAAKALYDPAVDETLCAHRWHFATGSFQLTRLTAAPTTKWDAAYLVPPETELIYGVVVNDKPIVFDRFANEIHCDAGVDDVVYAEVTARVSESYWPAYFAACVRLKLASQFAVALAEDANKANVFEGKFIRQMTSARLLDSQGRTAAKMPVGGLRAFMEPRANRMQGDLG